MCRHLCYLGPPRTLHKLMYEPPHSLVRQSYAPRYNLHSLINADGFGVGWYPADDGGAAERAADAVPTRFRRAQPIWTDVSFQEVSRVITSPCMVAAVRSATVGFPVEESCTQPFRFGPWLFSHNGAVEDFTGVEPKLRELAGDMADVPDARAPLDSALLFALAVRRWREGCPLGDGLADVVRTVVALASGRYNLLAADGSALAATTWGDSLFVRVRRCAAHGAVDRAPGGTGATSPADEVVIASEPYDDDPGWQRVPACSLVLADASGVRIDPL